MRLCNKYLLQCPSNELNWGEKRCALEYVDAVNDVRNINSILLFVNVEKHRKM